MLLLAGDSMPTYVLRRLYVLANDLEVDAQASTAVPQAPSAWRAGSATAPLASYLLPEMARRASSLIRLACPTFTWLLHWFRARETSTQSSAQEEVATSFRPSTELVRVVAG
jgi:hypothetical protein